MVGPMSEGDSSNASKPMTEEQIRKSAVGLTEKQLSGQVVLVEHDPAWPMLFARESTRIRSAMGGNGLAIEHVGSTSVPGLAAKPIIDILLVVANSADEKSYVPALEAAGYCSGSENLTGMSIECSRVQTRTLTFTCSARVATR